MILILKSYTIVSELKREVIWKLSLCLLILFRLGHGINIITILATHWWSFMIILRQSHLKRNFKKANNALIIYSLRLLWCIIFGDNVTLHMLKNDFWLFRQLISNLNLLKYINKDVTYLKYVGTEIKSNHCPWKALRT